MPTSAHPSRQTAPELTIIVVSYNTRDMTLACLKSLEVETSGISYELIVVDNDSSDGSAGAIAAAYPSARLIALKDNVGFARANNIAAELARGEHILLLNPDTVIIDRAIPRLVAFARRTPAAQIWGGRTLRGDGTLDPTSCFARLSFGSLLSRATGLASLVPDSALLNPEPMPGWPRDSEREVDVIAGCFLLITRQLWQRLGGFDPVFFMYGEEADLCLRARALGARPVFTHTATIIHYGGASERTRAGKMIKLLAGRATLIRRYFHPMLVEPGYALQGLWSLSRAVAFSVLHRLRPNDQRHSEAQAWREIWQARRQWYRGFPEAGASARERSKFHGIGGAQSTGP